MTNEELLNCFEAIIVELEEKTEANVTHDWVAYEFAVSDSREKLEQLKQGLV